MVLSPLTGMVEGGAGKKARASSPSRICEQDQDEVFLASKARAPPAPTWPSCFSGSFPGIQPGWPTLSHRESGPSSDQSIDEGWRCSAGSLRPWVRLGIGAVIAEEALGVHREGVREFQAVRKQDHNAQQHRLQPVRARERQRETGGGQRP